MITKFPTLYTVSKSGKNQCWSIKVINEGGQSRTIVEYGFVDGKITKNEKITKKGKNIGKKNETTHYTQAISDAQSKWNSKKDNGYSEKIQDSGGKKSSLQKSLLPMLALNYNVRYKDIKFPCFVQPKIDGARAIYKNGIFYSRLGKEFLKLDHISNELKDLDEDLVLDGELYSYDMTFQEIIGAIKKNKPETKKLIYIVYDLVDLKLDYIDRLKILRKNIKNLKSVKVITTEICDTPNDIITFHNEYVSQGYEGLIIRNFKGKYKLKHRSKDLQKLKEFEDDEFKIVDALSGTGKEQDMVIWIVKNKAGDTFKVRPLGSYLNRKQMYLDREKYIGKKLTVRYFGLSDTGIPRFPVGISIRDYE